MRPIHHAAPHAPALVLHGPAHHVAYAARCRRTTQPTLHAVGAPRSTMGAALLEADPGNPIPTISAFAAGQDVNQRLHLWETNLEGIRSLVKTVPSRNILAKNSGKNYDMGRMGITRAKTPVEAPPESGSLGEMGGKQISHSQ